MRFVLHRVGGVAVVDFMTRNELMRRLNAGDHIQNAHTGKFLHKNGRGYFIVFDRVTGKRAQGITSLGDAIKKWGEF